MAKKALPKILTTADWNSKKGVIAKMAGETGIGAELTKLAGLWAKADWDDLDPDAGITKQGGSSGKQTLIAYDKAFPLAKAEYPKVETVRTELVALNKLLTTIETKWKASKVIPSSSRQHVTNMKTASTALYNDLKTIGDSWVHAKERLTKEEERLKTIALGVIKPYFTSIREFGKTVEESPTVVNYVGAAKTGFFQNIRGLNAALDRSKNDALIAWKDTHWKPMAQAGWNPTKDDQVKAKVAKVLDVLDELEKQLA